MPKYIKLEDAKKAVCQMCEGGDKLVCGRLNDACDCMRILNDIPAVETAHVEKKREAVWKDDVLAILSGRNAAWDAYQKVKDLPAADVYEAERIDRYCLRCQEEYRERTSGKWVRVQDDLCECSVCRSYWIDFGDAYDFKYCPKCGSYMQGEDEDDD